MGALLAVLAPFRIVNEALFKVGRGLGVICVAAMVVADRKSVV